MLLAMVILLPHLAAANCMDARVPLMCFLVELFELIVVIEILPWVSSSVVGVVQLVVRIRHRETSANTFPFRENSVDAHTLGLHVDQPIQDPVTVRPKNNSELIPWAQKIEFESCK